MNKFVIAFLVGICVVGSAHAAGPIKIIKVDVECAGEDSLGMRVCSALKEMIRASSEFELVAQNEAEKDPLGFLCSYFIYNIYHAGWVTCVHGSCLHHSYSSQW